MVPLVSICIPTYNGEAHLEEALDSALAQTWDAFEVVVSDDASSDRTLEIVEARRREAPERIRVFTHERMGIAGNWNESVRRARGRWIKFLMHDDTLEPTCVEKLVARAAEDDGIGLVFCERHLGIAENELQDPGVRRLWERCRAVHEGWTKIGAVNDGRRLLADRQLFQGMLNKVGEPTVVMVRKAMLESVGPFDGELVQLLDMDMWMRVMARSRVGFVPERLATFRVHPGQFSVQNAASGDADADLVRLLRKLVDPAARPGMPAAMRRRADRLLALKEGRPWTLTQRIAAWWDRVRRPRETPA